MANFKLEPPAAALYIFDGCGRFAAPCLLPLCRDVVLAADGMSV